MTSILFQLPEYKRLCKFPLAGLQNVAEQFGIVHGEDIHEQVYNIICSEVDDLHLLNSALDAIITSILSMPPEIINVITEYLSVKDTLRLHSTCMVLNRSDPLPKYVEPMNEWLKAYQKSRPTPKALKNAYINTFSFAPKIYHTHLHKYLIERYLTKTQPFTSKQLMDYLPIIISYPLETEQFKLYLANANIELWNAFGAALHAPEKYHTVIVDLYLSSRGWSGMINDREYSYLVANHGNDNIPKLVSFQKHLVSESIKRGIAKLHLNCWVPYIHSFVLTDFLYNWRPVRYDKLIAVRNVFARYPISIDRLREILETELLFPVSGDNFGFYIEYIRMTYKEDGLAEYWETIYRYVVALRDKQRSIN